MARAQSGAFPREAGGPAGAMGNARAKREPV